LAGALVVEAAQNLKSGPIETDSKPIYVSNDQYTSTDIEPKSIYVSNDQYTSTDIEPKPIYVSNDQYTSTDIEPKPVMSDKHTSTEVETKIQMADAASQWYEEQLADKSKNISVMDSDNDSRPTSTYSDRSSQYEPHVMEERLAKFPEPPQSRGQTPMASLPSLATISAPLTMSSIVSEELEPLEAEYIEIKEAAPVPDTVQLPLVFSSIQSINTEPVEPPTPRQNAIPRPQDKAQQTVFVDEKAPQTPKPISIGSVFGWNKNKSKDHGAPIIAEDETRQSASNSPLAETPESQRPFRELSTNPHERTKQVSVTTSDESSQTALTADQIDKMLSSKKRDPALAEGSPKITSPPKGANLVASVRPKRSQESIGSTGRARSIVPDTHYVPESAPIKRPGSAGSGRAVSVSSFHPPLPVGHKEVIAAAAQRTGSSNGAGMAPWGGSSLEGSNGLVSPRTPSFGPPGSMGPPPLPASASRTSSAFRPRTPSSQQQPLSPSSVKGGTTPRPMHSSGNSEIRSPSRLAQTRSRTSSVSSFVSEVDTRFNLRNGMGMPHGIDSNTDPRMINAITQTMIGEYLWKYTRKAGRGTISENRHRRYFWVHPYTRTLYWSDRDPSSAGRAELKAKSVPIEAVRVVTDDNPMPPGLHRKSLVIMTPGRSVKFTATTGQRHETWFNALSYLLLRTGEDALGDTSDVANGALTQEDVDEFNPGFRGNRSTQGPGSLSSYNSRTTRNESPEKSRMPIQPHLSSTVGSRPSIGTFSRLSSYWKPSGEKLQSGSYSSRRSRNSLSANENIYEASEVHDSAEDLREMIEKQDRESDKLENVRACCDGAFAIVPPIWLSSTNLTIGKHDVGHLHSVKGRYGTVGSATGKASGANTGTASSRTKGRNSMARRTD
jgi:hypothetical protein